MQSVVERLFGKDNDKHLCSCNNLTEHEVFWCFYLKNVPWNGKTLFLLYFLHKTGRLIKVVVLVVVVAFIYNSSVCENKMLLILALILTL